MGVIPFSVMVAGIVLFAYCVKLLSTLNVRIKKNSLVALTAACVVTVAGPLVPFVKNRVAPVLMNVSIHTSIAVLAGNRSVAVVMIKKC